MNPPSPVAFTTFLVCVLPLAAQAQLLLPDNAHLIASPLQSHVLGSTNWWGTTATGRRMMILYEASHLTGAGVTGPIVITGLRFRGEDAEHNLGGQTFSGVTVSLYKTTLDTATMSPTSFAINLAPLAPHATTLIGTDNFASLVVPPSTGTVPNDDVVSLLLTNVGVFDPATDAQGQVNLLIDVRWTGHSPAPDGTSMVPTAVADANNSPRGRGIYATSPVATVGSTSSAPPIVAVEFSGPGGHATLAPARTEPIGASCGGAPSTFYQLFAEGHRFDLAGSGLTLIPDNVAAPNHYTVAGGAAPVDVTQVNGVPDSTLDDGLVTHALGFTFAYPGGSTSTIKPCTNGFVWLDPTMSSTDYTPSLIEWLGNTSTTPYRARLAPFWHDFSANRNTTSHPNSGLHVKTDTSGGPGNAVCYVTWLEVGDFNSVLSPGGQSVNTMQLVLHEVSGFVEFRYGAMSELWGSGISNNLMNGIVGFTRGRIGVVNSVDPQSRDLSHETPFATSVEGAIGNVGLTALASPFTEGPVYGARMFAGQSLIWNVYNIPANTIVALLAFDLVATRPGIEVPGITAPGCRISTSAAPPLFWETWVLPVGTASGSVAAPIPAGWEGTDMYAQAFGIDVFGGPDLLPWASNTIRYTVGLQ
jgi:hypothetical protein